MSLSLAILPQSNILDGITLNERVERSTLVKLINSTLLKKIPFHLYQNEKQQLTRYLALMDNGTIPVTYSRNPNNPYGRSNPVFGLGLFLIRREVRHTLSPNMVDLDIKNCHPVMLNQLCEINGIPHSELNNYVCHRQTYFNEGVSAYGCTQDDIKELFIKYMYGGSFGAWVAEVDDDGKQKIDILKCDAGVVNDEGKLLELTSFKQFRKSMKSIHNKIVEMNPDLTQIVSAKKEINIAGSVCSFVLQEYEIRVLEQLFLHCSSNNLIDSEVCVLCADGLMIERKFYNPELLNQFTELISRTIGFQLIFTEKPMTQGYEKILDKNLDFDLYTPIYTTGLIADYFSVMFSNKFVCFDGIVYQYNGVIWEIMEHKKNSVLHNFVDEKFHKCLIKYCMTKLKLFGDASVLCEDEEMKGKLKKKLGAVNTLLNNVNMLRNITQRNNLVAEIINKITTKLIVFDNDPFLFAFTNKVYDLRTNKFVPSVYSQYIRTTCKYDHITYYPSKFTDELFAIINTIFPNPEIRDYYLTILATGMYGELIEHLFIATGTGGNGKSLINAQMMKTVGSYGYKVGANVLLDEIKEGANPAIASLHNVRFGLAQEPNGKRRICTATLKELTGDKTLNARMAYSNECQINLKLTLVEECNELPLLDEVGGGVERRIRAVPFTSCAVPSDIYYALEDKTGYILANPYYKTDEFQHKHKQALFNILLPYWEAFQKNNYCMPEPPLESKLITRDYLATSDDIFSWFSEIYEKSDNVNEILYIENIYNRFTGSRVFQLMTKTQQKNYNKKEFNNKIEKNIFLKPFYRARNKTINGVQLTKPAIVGYRRIPEESHNECEDGFSDLETESVGFKTKKRRKRKNALIYNLFLLEIIIYAYYFTFSIFGGFLNLYIYAFLRFCVFCVSLLLYSILYILYILNYCFFFV